MAQGSVRCCGSSLYLKRLYGVGYTMTVVKNQSRQQRRDSDANESHDPFSSASAVKYTPQGSSYQVRKSAAIDVTQNVPSQPIIDFVFQRIQPNSYLERMRIATLQLGMPIGSSLSKSVSSKKQSSLLAPVATSIIKEDDPSSPSQSLDDGIREEKGEEIIQKTRPKYGDFFFSFL